MLRRCNKPESKDYARYGARGIKVRMSRRDFISWFVYYGKKFEKEHPLVRFAVGRVDHSGDYEFSNIEIVSHSENARESIYRNFLKPSLCRKCGRDL